MAKIMMGGFAKWISHFLLLLILITVIVESRKTSKHLKNIKTDAKKAERKGKLFSLFNVVTFRNEQCTTSSSRHGTCFTASECTSKGGAATGDCASGFGVCCLFTASTSASTISQNCTYIQNPGWPSGLSTDTAISYTVNKVSDDICTLRLDFETFVLKSPASQAAACPDSFIITTNPSATVPTICGTNTGEHMYIDMGATSSDTAKFAFSFESGSDSTRMFDIKVSQISCFDENKPDSGCTQWFTAASGRITSYNWAADTNFLQSQKYSICVRRNVGTCCVNYEPCSDVPNAFILAPSPAAAFDSGCVSEKDFILIEGVQDACIVGQNFPVHNKICKDLFTLQPSGTSEQPLCDCSAPFQIEFETDASGTSTDRGFCFDYTQIPC